MTKAKHTSTDMPWLQDYPAHIEWHMTLAPGTVKQLWQETANQFPNRPFCDFLDKNYSYGEMNTLVLKAAKGLQARGVSKGVRVGLFLPNCPYFPIFYYAAMHIGAIVVNFNPTYPTETVMKLVDMVSVSVMVTIDLEAVYELVEPTVGNSSVKTLIVCPFADVLPGIKSFLFPFFAKSRGLPLAKPSYSDKIIRYKDVIETSDMADEVDVLPNDIAVLQFTGGTTGLPKAAALTHTNLYINVQQAGNWFKEIKGEDDVVLAVLPFFHIFAMTVCLNYMVYRGAKIIMHPRYDTNMALEAFDKKKPTLFAGVPAIYTAINNAPKVADGKVDFSSLKYSISGGAALPIAVKHEFQNLTGCLLVEGYGLSETAPIVATQPVSEDGKERREREATIGLPVPGTRIDIVSLEDGETMLGYGEKNRGEICITGPQVMKGYWRNPEETANAFDSQGRFRTGDIGFMDEDGYTYIIDRKKDMILTHNGMSIYPRDIEEILYKHENIVEATVTGIKNESRGEIILASIVVKPNTSMTHQELCAYLEKKVPSYALPNISEFLDALPKSQIGKILKKDIRKNFLHKQANNIS